MRYQSVKEGISTILLPITGEVFYNPVQEFNRDLSVLAVYNFQQIFRERHKVLTMTLIILQYNLISRGSLKNQSKY